MGQPCRELPSKSDSFFMWKRALPAQHVVEQVASGKLERQPCVLANDEGAHQSNEVWVFAERLHMPKEFSF
jgi:hypothetical protein